MKCLVWDEKRVGDRGLAWVCAGIFFVGIFFFVVVFVFFTF